MRSLFGSRISARCPLPAGPPRRSFSGRVLSSVVAKGLYSSVSLAYLWTRAYHGTFAVREGVRLPTREGHVALRAFKGLDLGICQYHLVSKARLWV